MEKSPLLEDAKSVDQPIYSADETKYIGRLMDRLMRAKINRDKSHPEFNDRTYMQAYQNRERIANTYIVKDKTNKDFTVNSGTVEQKLRTVLAEINRLNLTGEIRAFDTEDNELYTLGMAFTDIVHKTEKMDDDEEKKAQRQLELLKQGTVFIQDNWVKEYAPAKTMQGKFTGKVKDTTWETKLEKVFEGPRRSILYGPGVYLGNIREFEMKKQPYIFTHKLTSYQEAKSRYGMQDADGKDVWERWKHVSNKRVPMVTEDSLPNINVSNGFALTDFNEDMVEEIHYQDRFNNEYQIFLNGIAMLPIGYPLSEITPGGEYNIEKQILYTINSFFAYGRSFIDSTEQLSDLLDEMIRLLILKTRKSIHPPYANISGKVISERSLAPGAITMGMDPNALVPLGKEGEGATASEYQMLNILKQNIDNITVSPQIQGQKGKTGTTAYEVNLLQQQAQKTIALIVAACGFLEKKATWMRHMYCLAYYFEPIGTKVDELRKELTNVYRRTSMKTSINGRGQGTRHIIPIENNKHNITSEDIYQMEEYYGVNAPKGNESRPYTRDELGLDPVQIIFIDLEILKACKYYFFAEVESKPKDTSENAKLMFREELRDIQALMQFGSQPNAPELENTYAMIWGRKKDKLFGKPVPAMPQQMQNGASSLNANSPGLSTTPSPTEQPMA